MDCTKLFFVFIMSWANFLALGLPLPSLTDNIASDLITAIKEKMEVDDVVEDVLPNLNFTFPINTNEKHLLQKLLPDDMTSINHNELLNMLQSLTRDSNPNLSMPSPDKIIKNKKSLEDASDQTYSPSNKLVEILKQVTRSNSHMEKRNPEGELLKLMRKWRRENRMRYLNNEILMSAYQHVLDV